MTSSAHRIIVGIAIVVLLALFVAGILVGAAVYGWKAAQKAGDEAATIQNMKTIAAVEIQYYNTHKRSFGTFEQLTREQMLTSKFSGDPPSTDGYIFTLKVTLSTSNQPSSYTLNAEPRSSQTGRNHFYADSTSASIHVNPDQPAGVADPVVEN
jgi:type II secretory pathway pseudopilin PulG